MCVVAMCLPMARLLFRTLLVQMITVLSAPPEAKRLPL